MATRVVGYPNDMLWDVSTPSLTPTAQYDAWAAALSVSNTATLYAVPIDDIAIMVDPAPKLLPAYRAMFSVAQDCGVGFYATPTSNITGSSSNSQAVGLPRLFSLGVPNHYLGWAIPNVDMGGTTKVQRGSDGTVIMFGTKNTLSQPTVNPCTWAMRINPDGTVVFLISVTATTSGVGYSIFWYNYGVIGCNPVTLETVAQGVSRQYAITVADSTGNFGGVLRPAQLIMKAINFGQTPEWGLKSAPVPVYGFGITVPTIFPLKLLPIAQLLKDFNNGGNYTVSGTVRESASPTDLPVQRRVRLHRKNDGSLIREVFSNPDGSYAFNYIQNTSYYVVAFDHTGNYNAVIKDSITPELIP